MSKLKKLFTETNMTWSKVIILALASAVFTALTAIIPFLKETSFHDAAVYPDLWFLLAVIIIMNCKKWQEASLKTFVFFLISQPLIYLLQVPFSWMGWDIFMYYKRWFIATLLTLPGAAIAFMVKKQNWLSVPILSVATSALAFMSVYYLKSLPSVFPNHLLSIIFCLAVACTFILVLLDKKEHKLAAAGITALALVGALVVL